MCEAKAVKASLSLCFLKDSLQFLSRGECLVSVAEVYRFDVCRIKSAADVHEAKLAEARRKNAKQLQEKESAWITDMDEVNDSNIKVRNLA